MFFIGGGGIGKSYFIRVIYYIVLKIFRYGLLNLEMLIFLMMVLIGVVVVNIDVIIINIGLVIFKDVGDNLWVLFD